MVIGLSSCSQDDLVASQDQLTISESELMLSGGEASPVEVTIQSNTPEWSYINGADWLHITRTTKGVSLQAERNTTGTLRHTTVGIMSGNLMRKLEVSQQPATPGEGSGSIIVENTEISVDQWGGTITIPVISDSPNWDILLSEDWLTAVANPRKKTVVLTIPETPLLIKRSVNLLIQNQEDGNTVTVTITQDGQIYYLEPILKYGATVEEIEAQELKRRSTLVYRPSSSSTPDRLKFRTVSSLFSRVEYVIKDDKMIEGYIYAPYYMYDLVIADFSKWLIEKGYEQVNPIMFFNPETRVEATMALAPGGAEWYVCFAHRPQQTKSQPTFESLPMGLVEEKDWQTYTKARIHAWETEHHGETSPSDERIDNTEGTRQMRYYPGAESTSSFSSSTYLLKLDEGGNAPLMSVMHVFPDEEEYTEKFFWNNGGDYLLTEEFMALAKKSGFEYYGKASNGSYLFLNKARKTICGVRMIIPSSTYINPFVTITYEYSAE